MFDGDPVICNWRNLISCLSGAVAERVIYQIADASVTGHKTLQAEDLVVATVHAERGVTCEKDLAPCVHMPFKSIFSCSCNASET